MAMALHLVPVAIVAVSLMTTYPKTVTTQHAVMVTWMVTQYTVPTAFRITICRFRMHQAVNPMRLMRATSS